MSKDVKVEIIYYKSETDVSLEFGLHGNYPVRLLSSSCNNLTLFFHSLKRAVSRSQIIIIVGGYTGDEFIPSFIARAINKEVVVPEYNKLGVICKEKYPLPEGAAPLAPSNKRFGGFLIESGPQTIINLTENKKIRLQVVSEVVVKYIEEHHNYFLNAVVTKQSIDDSIDSLSVLPQIPQNEDTEAVTLPSQFEDVSSNSFSSDETETEQEPTIVDIPSEKAAEETEETAAAAVTLPATTDSTPNSEETLSTSDTDVVTETAVEPSQSETVQEATENNIEEPIDIISHKYRDPESNILKDITPDDINFDKPTAESTKPPVVKNKNKKTRPKRRAVRITCIILSLLIILGSIAGIFIHNHYKNSNDTIDCYTLLTETYNRYGENYAAAFEALKQHNEKIEAWLSLSNSSLNYPVLLTHADDDFYFDHLPDESENVTGSVYSSCDISAEHLSNNVIFYGSAQSGLGVFSEIVELFDVEDISQIEPIIFTNKHGQSKWRIFSLFTEAEAEDLVFEIDSFESTEKYNAFVNQLIRNNRTNLLGQLTDSSAPVLMLIAVDGEKRYIACAAPFDNVSYKENNNNITKLPGLNGTLNDILVNIKDAVIEFEGKTDENTDEFEQKPIDPDNVITLPQITVKPPAGNTSSEDKVTSSNITSSKNPSSSSSSSSSSDISSSQTPDSSESTNESSSITSSSEDISSEESSSNTNNVSSDISSETSSATSSEGTSSDTSSESESSSSETSSDATSSGSSSETDPKPEIDPLYTWDINLYIKQKDGSIVYGTASEIVARVIEAEMGSGFPLEALKAQAAAAYSWLLNNGAMNKSTAPSGVPMKSVPGARAIQAVSEVKGTLITYEGTIAQTYYYAYSAGFTANVQDIWSSKIPYLQSVECPVDAELSNFITTKTYTADKIKELILSKYGIDVSEMEKTEWIKPIEYDNNNTYCTKVEIGGVQFKGTSLRSKLLDNGIRSSAYTVEYDSETDSFIISCKGWGHGVGMSQQGAKAYANLGWTYEQILTHFYPGTTLLHF